MSMRVDSSLAARILSRWDKDETQEMISDMSRQIRSAAENGKLGHNWHDESVGLSLAASLRDPIFWEKLDLLFHTSFN